MYFHNIGVRWLPVAAGTSGSCAGLNVVCAGPMGGGPAAAAPPQVSLRCPASHLAVKTTTGLSEPLLAIFCGTDDVLQNWCVVINLNALYFPTFLWFWQQWAGLET